MTPGTSTTTAPRPPLRLALGSVLLGMFGLFLSVFVIGALPALAGLALGLAYLRRPGVPKALGRWGVGLCACALLSSGVFALAWRSGMAHRREALDQFIAQLPAWRGVAAPSATFRRLDDSTIRLADLRGRRVMVHFWASSAPPCGEMVPSLVRLRRETAAQDLEILAVSLERPHDQQRFAERHGLNYTLCWLGRLDVLPPPFDNVLAVPVTFIVDRHGIIVEAVSGEMDHDHLRAKAMVPDWSGPTNAPPPLRLR